MGTPPPENIPLQIKQLEENKAKDPEANKDEETCLYKCKTLWKPRTRIAIFDIGLYKFDIGSDFYTAYEHFQNCNYVLSMATLICVMLPTIPIFLDFLRRKIKEVKEPYS